MSGLDRFLKAAGVCLLLSLAMVGAMTVRLIVEDKPDGWLGAPAEAAAAPTTTGPSWPLHTLTHSGATTAWHARFLKFHSDVGQHNIMAVFRQNIRNEYERATGRSMTIATETAVVEVAHGLFAATMAVEFTEPEWDDMIRASGPRYEQYRPRMEAAMKRVEAVLAGATNRIVVAAQ